ncbi:pentapeptide repeat-containing protein [Thaumasiovibrio sp. DFM-14]|uniref:pentapeptide repeat-containing protein n=1 Tax=Thaumasiovibrio sp. DFM-14 TaxID=3384792 RepID=UPI00399F8DC6
MRIESNKQHFEETFNQQTLLSADISVTEFEQCEFNHCDFSSTTFSHCKFINCSFNHCNLSLIKISHSRFFEVEFTECKIIGVDWTKAYWPPYHLDSELKFNQCILNDSSFFGLTLHELNLTHCKLHEADFREGDFPNSSMQNCDFTNSLFMRTNLQNVDFTESWNFTIDVLQNKITNAKFSRYEALSLLDSLEIELVD